MNCPENVFLVGSVSELRNWSPDDAIPLSSTDYPTWSGEYSDSGLCAFWRVLLTRFWPTVTVTLPASTTIDYKYIKKNGDTVVWASDPNWRWESPASGTATLEDSWR